MNRFVTQFSEIDISILRFIHHNRITAIDGLLYYLSFATTFVSASLLIIILIKGLKTKSKYLINKFYILSIILLCSGCLSLGLKYSLYRERPFVTYPDIQKLSAAGNSSFPSGHTLEAFAIAFGISFLFSKRVYSILIFAWAFLIAYSRMALGVHYPFDVISGILLGVTLSYIIMILYKQILIKKSQLK